MQHKSFEFIDNSINYKKTDTYNMSIQSSLNGLCFSVFDTVGKRHVAFRRTVYPQAIIDYNDLHKFFGQTIDTTPLLNIPFKQVVLMHASRSISLVPEKLAESQMLKPLLKLTAPLHELDEIHTTPIASIKAQAIFGVPTPIAALLNRKVGKVRFTHPAAALLGQLHIRHNENKNDHSMGVNLTGNMADIALWGKQGLLLYNTFDIHCSADLIYYLTYIGKLHKVNMSKTYIYTAGDTEEHSDTLVEFFSQTLPLGAVPALPAHPDNLRYNLLFDLI